MAPMAGTTVTLPDGSPLELSEGATGADAAAAIGPGLAKAALAIQVGGETRDLAAPLADGEAIEIVTAKSPGALELIRHDAAHVMAEAVCELYPGTKVSSAAMCSAILASIRSRSASVTFAPSGNSKS